MDSRINRKNGILVYNWCKQQFGRSTINGNYPQFIFHRTVIDKEYAKCLGQYDPCLNSIEVFQQPFINKNRRFLTFINTIIHEFTHYHQDIKVKYWKLDEIYKYNDHPMEIEANKVAKKYQYICYQEVFNQNKKKS